MHREHPFRQLAFNLKAKRLQVRQVEVLFTDDNRLEIGFGHKRSIP